MAQPVPGLAEAERLTYQGYGLLGLGQTGDAMSAFRAALVTDPSPEQALRARTGLAQGYAQDGQLDAAIAELDAVLAKDKDFALASVWKGALLAQQGKAAEAEQLLLDAGLASRQTSLPAMQRVTGLAALAEAQFAQSKLDAVEQTLKQMKEIAPRVLIASYLGARLALARNDAPAAVIEMQRVVQAAPELAAGRFLLAQALAATGNYGQAETELQAVVTAEPDNIEARKLLADMQIRAGRPDAAAESLFPALKANSTDPQVYSLFGRAKFESGDRDTATMFWERSLAQSPDDSRLKLSLAADYIGSGQSQRALDLLATVPDAEGGKQKKQMQLIAMAAGKDPARASEEIAALVARNAGDLELRNLAATWHTSRGEFEQARGYLDAALKQQPDDLPTLINLARLQATAQDLDGATATLERALKVKSDSGPVLLGLSQVATARGDTAAAKRWLEEWRKRDPTSAEARLLLAQQALAQRDTKGGNQLIEEALQVAPKQAGVANAAGQVLLEAGRYDEALRRFREAIELSPEMPELHYNAARAQIALNQREAARESLNKTLSLRSDWPPALVLLAQLDARAGRFDAALGGAAKLKQSAQPAAGFMLEGEVRHGHARVRRGREGVCRGRAAAADRSRPQWRFTRRAGTENCHSPSNRCSTGLPPIRRTCRRALRWRSGDSRRVTSRAPSANTSGSTNRRPARRCCRTTSRGSTARRATRGPSQWPPRPTRRRRTRGPSPTPTAGSWCARAKLRKPLRYSSKLMKNQEITQKSRIIWALPMPRRGRPDRRGPCWPRPLPAQAPPPGRPLRNASWTP